MIYRIVRGAMVATLFTVLIWPLLGQIPAPFVTSISSSVNSFISTTSTYLINVKGLINQFLYAGGGNPAIVVFNGLIWASLLTPVFGLTARLTVAIYHHFF